MNAVQDAKSAAYLSVLGLGEAHQGPTHSATKMSRSLKMHATVATIQHAASLPFPACEGICSKQVLHKRAVTVL